MYASSSLMRASGSGSARPSAARTLPRMRSRASLMREPTGRPLASQRRHDESAADRLVFGPTRRDHFGARIKIHAFHAMHMEVAEERILPAAERKERHRHGDRHVDA